MTQDLIGHRWCLSDYKKCTEVDRDRYQTGQHNENLQWSEINCYNQKEKKGKKKEHNCKKSCKHDMK